MATTYFTKEHEWLRVEGDVAAIGITNHAQQQLGDVVFVEVPEVGRTIAAGEDVAVVESVKAASEIYAPLAGEIVEGNKALVDNPATVNEDPEGAAWFFKMRLSDPSAVSTLMSAEAYQSYVDSLD